MATYTTKAGQQWDQIALDVYGSEKSADILMEANPQQIGVYQFDAGTVLIVPEKAAEQSPSMPPWR